jgi:hypothetical protein
LHLPESAFRLVRELEGALRVYHNRVMNAPDIGRESAAREPDLDNNKLLEVSRALWTFGGVFFADMSMRAARRAPPLADSALGTTYLSTKHEVNPGFGRAPATFTRQAAAGRVLYTEKATSARIGCTTDGT